MIICIIEFRNDEQKTINYTRQVNPVGHSIKEISEALAWNIKNAYAGKAEFLVVRFIKEERPNDLVKSFIDYHKNKVSEKRKTGKQILKILGEDKIGR